MRPQVSAVPPSVNAGHRRAERGRCLRRGPRRAAVRGQLHAHPRGARRAVRARVEPDFEAGNRGPAGNREAEIPEPVAILAGVGAGRARAGPAVGIRRERRIVTERVYGPGLEPVRIPARIRRGEGGTREAGRASAACASAWRRDRQRAAACDPLMGRGNLDSRRRRLPNLR